MKTEFILLYLAIYVFSYYCFWCTWLNWYKNEIYNTPKKECVTFWANFYIIPVINIIPFIWLWIWLTNENMKYITYKIK